MGLTLSIYFFSARGKEKKTLRTTFESSWSPLPESQTSSYLERYFEKHSQSAKALDYVPVGNHLVNDCPLSLTKTAALVHPDGHSIILVSQSVNRIKADRFVQSRVVRALKIQSFLDDGSVIESSNADDPETIVQKKLKVDRAGAEAYLARHPESNTSLLYSEMAPYGFLINLYPGAPIEELLEAHDRSVQAVLADPNVGLRRLTVENWRQYAIYASRHFDQIKFELGRADNAPQPFTFPDGELIEEGSTRFLVGTTSLDPLLPRL